MFPNILPYAAVFQTEKALYLSRQYLFSCLYDRISTRPFLNISEKKWIAFQLLTAVKDLHSQGIVHGDLKLENILVTTWNWVMITDLASFKPVYLPEYDPADFSYYFDSSARGCCYVAPERFLNEKQYRNYYNGFHATSFDSFKSSMDIFSLGCILAELFLDGTVIFNLNLLLKYKKGELQIEPLLEKIEDKEVVKLILHMTQLDYEKRHSAFFYWQEWKNIFPDFDYFPSFYDLVKEISYPHLYSFNEAQLPQRSVSDWKIFKIHENFLLIIEWFILRTTRRKKGDREVSYNSSILKIISLLDFPVLDRCDSHHFGTNETLALVISIVCSSLRDCSFPSLKVKAVEVLLALGLFVKDQYKLDLILPYFLSLAASDSSALVKTMALKAFASLLTCVDSIGLIDSGIISEYVLSQLRLLSNNENDLVRVTFADTLGPLSEISLNILEISQNSCNDTDLLQGTSSESLAFLKTLNSYSKRLEDLRGGFQEQIQIMLVDDDINVKRCVLHNISSLCLLLGKQRSSDVLLSHMITYLNDRSWQLRREFFSSLVDIGAYIGGSTLEKYIMPLITQSFLDHEYLVVEKVIFALCSLVELGFLQKVKLKMLLKTISSILYHFSTRLRLAILKFITTVTRQFSNIELTYLNNCIIGDYFVDVAPLTQHCSTLSLLSFMRRPVSYECWIAAVNIIAANNYDTRFCSDQGFIKSLLSYGFNNSDITKCCKIFSIGAFYNNFQSKSDNLTLRENILRHKIKIPQTIFLNLESEDVQLKSKVTESVSPYLQNDRITLLAGELEEKSNANKLSLTVVNSSFSGRSSPSTSTSKSFVRAVSNISRNGFNNPPMLKIKFQAAPVAEKVPDSNDPSFLVSVKNFIESKTKELFPPEILDLGPKTTIPFRNHSRAKSISNLNLKESLKPNGILVSYLKEHKAAVNTIALSPNRNIFGSCSDDGSVKIWNCSKLDTFMSHSSQMCYDHDGKYKHLIFCENYESVCVCSNKGHIDIIRIEVQGNSGGSPQKNKGCVMRRLMFDDEIPLFSGHYLTGSSLLLTVDTQNLVVAGTDKGMLYGFDLRTSKIAWNMKSPVHYGMLSAIGLENETKSWFLTGTSLGVVSCWDSRFQHEVRSFSLPSSGPIRQISPNLLRRNDESFNSTFLIASSRNQLSSWAIDSVSCREIFCASTLSDKISRHVKHLVPLSPPHRHDFVWKSKVIADLTKCDEFYSFAQHEDYLITGGSDLLLRLWNVNSIEKSCVLLNPSSEYDRSFSSYRVNDVLFHYERTFKNSSSAKLSGGPHFKMNNDYSGHHTDAITSVVIGENSFPFVVTGCKDGSIRILK